MLRTPCSRTGLLPKKKPFWPFLPSLLGGPAHPSGASWLFHVNFGKGGRNKFHAHDGEQILIVTHGRGIVATESEEKIVTQGDIILIPAGEKHWHGATKDSKFSHIFITTKEYKTTPLGD